MAAAAADGDDDGRGGTVPVSDRQRGYEVKLSDRQQWLYGSVDCGGSMVNRCTLD